MIRSTISFCLVSFILIACNNGEDATKTASATDTTTEAKKDETPPAPPVVDSATAAKNWEAYMTPGKEHEMMAKWNGTWTGEVQMWMAPNTEPMKNMSTAINKMILGGRRIIKKHHGYFNGMPFDGMSTLAFDNHKKVFISSWMDNMGTGVMNLEGPWDEATKSITLKGKMIDPSTGYETTVREVFKIVDDNTQHLEMYAPTPDGKEFKTMEITYKRSSKTFQPPKLKNG